MPDRPRPSEPPPPLERIAAALEQLAALERERLDFEHPHRVGAPDPAGDQLARLLDRLRVGIASHAYASELDRDVLELVAIVDGWRMA